MQNLLNENLENLKRLSLRWIVRKGFGLAEAEDLFQQSILKALTSEAPLSDQQKLQSWFMSILRNTLLDHLRSRKLHLEKEKQFQLEKELEADDHEIEESFCKCVNQLLGDLPDQDRQLLHEHFFNGKSFATLAQEIKIPEGTLRVKSLRARDRLKEMFKACCNVKKFNDLEDCGCD